MQIIHNSAEHAADNFLGIHLFQELVLERIKMHGYATHLYREVNLDLESVTKILREKKLVLIQEYGSENTYTYGSGSLWLAPNQRQLIIAQDLSGNSTSITVFGHGLDEIREAYKVLDLKIDLPENQISVNFICSGVNRIKKNVAKLNIQKFSEIRDNYSGKVISKIERLLELKNPETIGKIIFWHGPAGTGKTHLVGALLRHWRERYKISAEIIIDPEIFLTSPSYMQDFLTSNESQKLRVVVMEDAGRFLTTAAREASGFFRFLNLTDGLLGQGQRIIFLFTANEAIETIDPAVLRAGRCLQQLEIPQLSQAEAKEWLSKRGLELAAYEAKNRDDYSLASLFEFSKKLELDRNFESKSFGF